MTVLQEPTSQRPILVAVDFSSPAQAALMFACRLAQKVDAPLLVLHVQHEPASQVGYYRKHDISGRMLPLDEVAHAMLGDLLMRLKAEDPSLDALSSARTMVVAGLPADRIPEVAEREDAAMIVMGTSGRSGLARLFNGSITHEVAKRSPVPVTTIKAPDADWDDNPIAHRLGSADWWSHPAGTPPVT